MLTPKDHALLKKVQDKLIALYVQHDEASRAEDLNKISVLETEINAAMEIRAKLRGYG